MGLLIYRKRSPCLAAARSRSGSTLHLAPLRYLARKGFGLSVFVLR